MVRLERAMTNIGMAMADGKEILSITHGNHPTKPPYHRPPISIKGEWGILQREARRSATYGRAKTTSHELKWSTVASKIYLHSRSNFHRAHRCKTQKPPPLHNPNFKFRTQKAKPKKWRDLAKLQDLNSFVSNELQKIEQITADISPLRTTSGHTVTQTEDCRVTIGCSHNSN